MSDQLTSLQVVRDLGMVVIPGLTTLGGALRRSSEQALWEAEVRNRLARAIVSVLVINPLRRRGLTQLPIGF